MAQYLERNIYLPHLNNEIAISRNSTFKFNLMSLNKFVLIKFTEEQTVVPPQSPWFGYYNENLELVPMQQQPIYVEDWIGLRYSWYLSVCKNERSS
jgi:palmitoyl-protein thioesterase